MPLTGRTVNLNAILPVQYQQFVLTPSQINNAFGTPIVLLPGIPNHSIIPLFGAITKLAGTAYTLGAATNWRIAWDAGASSYASLPLAGIFDQAGQKTAQILSPNVGGLTCIATYYPNNLLVGASLIYGHAGGETSVGDSNLIIQLFYQIWPDGPFPYL